VGLYGRFVVPRLINLAMKQSMLSERRAALVPRAKGTVLEVGIGSGLNLPYYSDEVERLYGVDPSPQLLAMARSNARKAQLAVELVCESAERLPFADASFDCAIMTWTLCSIPHAGRALREVHRVLKPGGMLAILEFSHPQGRIMKTAYGFYSRLLLPAIGSLVSGAPGAYAYLPESIRKFPGAPELRSMMNSAGFVETRFELLTGGIAALHTGLAAGST